MRDATNNRLVIEVESSRGGWLVVPHTWDPGWRARLDGRPAPLFRANYAFRAVRVPGGKHRVEMSYWPVGLTPGLLCSAAAALAAVMSLSWRALRRRRESLAVDPLRS